MSSVYSFFRRRTSQPLMSYKSFGFLDGISQPAVQGFDTKPFPGQETVRQGIILLGREGDAPNVPNVTTRPPWALDGSLLSFRYLFQLVPEFDTFTKEHAIPGIPPDQGSELLGARLVGRWKSGRWSHMLIFESRSYNEHANNLQEHLSISLP